MTKRKTATAYTRDEFFSCEFESEDYGHLEVPYSDEIWQWIEAKERAAKIEVLNYILEGLFYKENDIELDSPLVDGYIIIEKIQQLRAVESGENK